MSDVEKFYYAIQGNLGGSVPWNSLHPIQQAQFVQAINTMIQICASNQIFQEESTVWNSLVSTT